MDAISSIKSVVLGEGTLAIQCAEILLEGGHHLLRVVSSDASVRDWAAEKNIIFAESTGDLSKLLGEIEFDYLFSIVNYRIIPSEVLKLPRKNAINFHDSMLPRYAGAYATSWAIMNRERTHGVSWHVMSEEIDAGDVLKSRQVEISIRETAFSLNAKCYEAAILTFRELIADLSDGKLKPVSQCLEERSYYGFYTRPAAAGLISWNSSAEDIDALVRALDFGPYPNPLGVAKFAIGDQFISVSETSVLDSSARVLPGTITSIAGDAITIATADTEIALKKLSTIEGNALTIQELVLRYGLKEGDRLEELSGLRDRISILNAAACKHERFWVDRLSDVISVDLDSSNNVPAQSSSTHNILKFQTPAALDRLIDEGAFGCTRNEFLLAAFGVFLARTRNLYRFDIDFSSPELRLEVCGIEAIFESLFPVRFDLNDDPNIGSVIDTTQKQLAGLNRSPYARDIFGRYPELRSKRGPTITISFAVIDQLEIGSVLRHPFVFVVRKTSNDLIWAYDVTEHEAKQIGSSLRRFLVFLDALCSDPDRCISELPLLTTEERHQLLVEWNQTRTEFQRDRCVHHLIADQTKRTPNAVAIAFGGEELTYIELDRRANQLARHLRSRGVGPEVLVGICVERSLSLVVGLLGILKAGGAYVPLDPNYPAERLAFMLADSAASLVLTDSAVRNRIPADETRIMDLDTNREVFEQEDATDPCYEVDSENIAYVIYTSGSTGKPKGVMVEHRNVVNFFAGMDQRFGSDATGVFLAVTSISFDISVLELFWTLTRGFKVVLYSQSVKTTHDQRPMTEDGPWLSDMPTNIGHYTSRDLSHRSSQPLSFSLAYFASNESAPPENKYQLLIEGAKFADEHNFAAVWTPERHFHDFGGLYPNPSVVSAALASVTNRIHLRAGSVVLPLHNPIRVAEEWSVVDNLSGGRVGISFASGWHPNDFVFAPENYADRKDLTFQNLETVRKLWRGDSITAASGSGKDVNVRILPRPIQPDLPIWITAAGHPDTFRMAGEAGANLLTHLLGQTVESLGKKIAIYRDSWKSNGHPGEGIVTVMLHTFVWNDTDLAREKVRTPLTNYLKSSVDLIKNAPWSFPTFAKPGSASAIDPEQLKGETLEALAEHAFNRYFETSGLFGTPERCLSVVAQMKAIGVDEIACLIDFGVDLESVLSSLQYLDEVRRRSVEVSARQPVSVPELISAHGVTHLQCTPSMLSMLLHERRSRDALRSLKTLMVGGEALSSSVAQELRTVTEADVYNMYGPTETTVWSTTRQIDGEDCAVSIGRPIANTELYVLDERLEPVAVGMPGELFIGGAGVVRGYLNRPQLTAERFVRNPFNHGSSARLYKTGDRVRYQSDGNLEFIGRMDNQVKVLGHRIELGEIEAALNSHPAVRTCAVILSETTPSDKRILAYVVRVPGATTSGTELRTHLSEKLPSFMTPAAVVFLDEIPLTPNGKLDRRALRAFELVASTAEEFVPPRTAVEEALSNIWSDVLGVARVGIKEDFFDLGGQSLLAVQIVVRIREAFSLDLALADLFQRPTIEDLAMKVEQDLLDKADNERLAELIDEFDGLSDDEIKSLIEREGRIDAVAGGSQR